MAAEEKETAINSECAFKKTVNRVCCVNIR